MKSIFKGGLEYFSKIISIKHNHLDRVKEGKHYYLLKGYEFVKNVDFTSFAEKLVKPQGGRPTEEYILTLDTADELRQFKHNSYNIGIAPNVNKLYLWTEQRIKGL
ncbi:MAG TPA: hypothetical protein DD434_13180 [Bacteroidales bacterium]|nr:hypothetical protein [Bacteroidales bacterium]